MRKVGLYKKVVGLAGMCLLGLQLLSISGWSQARPIEGIRENTPRVHALVNARIVQAPGKVIEKGVIVIRDDVIEAVGATVIPPADARIWDYSGKTIYPGLIESYAHIGLPSVKKKKPEHRLASVPEKKESVKGPAYWNPRVRPEIEVSQLYHPTKEEMEKMWELGFTAALIVPGKGVLRGHSTLVSLKEGEINEQIIRDDVFQHLAFEHGAFRDTTYPNSLMGAIALIRQTLLDAQWYQAAHQAYRLSPMTNSRPETNLSLSALQDVIVHRQPVVFEVSDDLNFLRAMKIAREFRLRTVIRGSGHEYRQLRRVKTARVPLIIPVNFPQELAVETPEEALSVSLAELQHWENAPENPRRLHEAGILFALTTEGLKKKEDFYSRLREAIQRGLPEDAALQALTLTPAQILGVADRLGSIEPGKLAHLIVADGNLFAKRRKILDVWVDGHRFVVSPQPLVDPRGRWRVWLDFPEGRTRTVELDLNGEVQALKGNLRVNSIEIPLRESKLELRCLSLIFPGDSLQYPGFIRISGSVKKHEITGHGELPDGRGFSWHARWLEALPEEEQKEEPEPELLQAPAARPVFPPGAYGRPTLPEQPTLVLVKNATLWTCGPQGKLEKADMLIAQGKIRRIGPNLKAPEGAMVIDATGKHVTPGLIDAHSHTGIDGGVNESTQAVTSEVRIEDVVDSYDIAFYRELAGGLTVINQLHGSANPIGGQNSIIKLRWGMHPDGLKLRTAPSGIKFALGENVKQSNWGDQFKTRYPQTRMGVEQIIRDRFKAALDYEKEWKAYKALPKRQRMQTIPPRRDLELEALREVLQGKRMIHSHSYRQDEILMLIRVAEDFGCRIGIFQHVLEGYKIAEAIAEHGAGASTFSDWWAYKFEVYDAIPFNGTLMDRVGVVVSFNSDSDELARRLNTEAAKAVKYGGLSEEEALKFVTINPARQLKIDDRVGSLEPGKDADFVIWSGNPLSTYTVCEQTWIDGRKFFDRETDLLMRKQVEKERARLIQKYLSKKKEKKKEERPLISQRFH